MSLQDWSNASPFMMHRQHHASGNQQLQTQMSMFFHLPKKYVGQLSLSFRLVSVCNFGTLKLF